MSRFADPKATGRFVLPGPCVCPGQPHDEDWMDVRTQLGTADIIFLEEAATPMDRMERLIVGWNLRDDDGSEAAVDREHIDRLYGDQQFFAAFDRWSRQNTQLKPLPNGSGAPSRNGSRGSATQPRATQKQS